MVVLRGDGRSGKQLEGPQDLHNACGPHPPVSTPVSQHPYMWVCAGLPHRLVNCCPTGQQTTRGTPQPLMCWHQTSVWLASWVVLLSSRDVMSQVSDINNMPGTPHTSCEPPSHLRMSHV